MWLLKNNILQNHTLSHLKIKHFITTKKPGNMLDISLRDEILTKNGTSSKSLVTAEQVHGNKIHFVKPEDKGKKIVGVDGLITAFDGLSLGIFTADCVPLFVVDKGTKKIGLIHIGWKPLHQGIIENFIEIFDAKCENIVAVIGPHICEKCYKVSESFSEYFPGNYKDGYMNLQKEIIGRLTGRGVIENNIVPIDSTRFCTYHNNDLFFSYRRDDKTSRHLSIINRAQ